MAMKIAIALLLLSSFSTTVSATTTPSQVQTLRGARRRIQSTTNTHIRNLKKKKGDGDETPGLFAHKQNRIDPTTGEIIITTKKHKNKTHIDREGRQVDINGNPLDKNGRQITISERCKKPFSIMKVEDKELKEQLKQAEKEAQKQPKPAVVPFGEVGDIKEQREDATTATAEGDEGVVKKTSSAVGDKKKGSPPAPSPPSTPSIPFVERSIDPITGEWKPPHTSSPNTQAEAEALQLAAELAEQAAIEAAAEGFDIFGGSLTGSGDSTLEELQGTVISNSMCDEDGNLLPSYTSFSPTVTPALDEGDTDNDGLLNWQEDEYGTNKTNVDSDGDGLTDSQEVIMGTDPLKVDTDGDGVNDYTELMDGTNPLDELDYEKKDLVDGMEGADNDGDGLLNEKETELGTDVDNADTDGDGLSDGMEVIYQQTDPLKVDTDSDGLTDHEEVMIYGTNPNNPDSDGDGYSDGFEISQNLDPLVPNDYTSDSLAISPGCESYLNDTVYVTSVPAAIDLEYEISIDDSASIDIVNERMENVMAKLIGETLINCGQLSSDSNQVADDGAVRRTRRRRSLTSRHLLVDGIDPSPQDIILTKKTCSYYTADNTDTPSNSKCYVIKSLSKLYLREDNAQSSPWHSSQQALRVLLDAMNSPSPSPFLESSGDREYSVEGVKGVRYIMGTPDESGVLLIDNSGGSGLNNGEGIDGAQEADTKSDGDGSLDPLSPVGITLIVLGCVGILAIALVAGRNIRKRKDNGQKKSLQYAEFYDDENDLDMKHHGLDDKMDTYTDRDASSLHGTPSPKRSRRGDHRREDDSIFSGLESPGNETTLDPAFIHTRTSNHNRDDGSQSQITAEQGYEAGMQFYPRDPFPRSKYEPKVQVESPKYENPAGMKQPPERNGRVYHVGDTVEF